MFNIIDKMVKYKYIYDTKLNNKNKNFFLEIFDRSILHKKKLKKEKKKYLKKKVYFKLIKENKKKTTKNKIAKKKKEENKKKIIKNKIAKKKKEEEKSYLFLLNNLTKYLKKIKCKKIIENSDIKNNNYYVDSLNKSNLDLKNTYEALIKNYGYTSFNYNKLKNLKLIDKSPLVSYDITNLFNTFEEEALEDDYMDISLIVDLLHTYYSILFLKDIKFNYYLHGENFGIFTYNLSSFLITSSTLTLKHKFINYIIKKKSVTGFLKYKAYFNIRDNLKTKYKHINKYFYYLYLNSSLMFNTGFDIATLYNKEANFYKPTLLSLITSDNIEVRQNSQNILKYLNLILFYKIKMNKVVYFLQKNDFN